MIALLKKFLIFVFKCGAPAWGSTKLPAIIVSTIPANSEFWMKEEGIKTIYQIKVVAIVQ